MRLMLCLVVCVCTHTAVLAQDDAPPADTSTPPAADESTPPPLDVIELVNGDRVSGHIVETNDEGTVIESPVFGKVLIPHGHIAHVETRATAEDTEAAARVQGAEQAAVAAQAEGADTSTLATVMPPEEPEKVRPGLFGTGFLEGWNKTFALGVAGSDGNTEEFNINLGLTLDHEDETDRWLFDSQYFASTSDGSTTKNQGYARLVKDWLIPEEKYYFFAEGRFDWDEFQSWDQRLLATGGVGYQFIKNDDLDLRGRVGAGVSKEWGSMNDDWTPIGLWGVIVNWQIAENHKLGFETTGYPALDDSGQYSQISSLSWVLTIDAETGLDLKLGLEHQYQSVVDSGKKHNDLLYYAALLFNF